MGWADLGQLVPRCPCWRGSRRGWGCSRRNHRTYDSLARSRLNWVRGKHPGRLLRRQDEGSSLTVAQNKYLVNGSAASFCKGGSCGTDSASWTLWFGEEGVLEDSTVIPGTRCSSFGSSVALGLLSRLSPKNSHQNKHTSKQTNTPPVRDVGAEGGVRRGGGSLGEQLPFPAQTLSLPAGLQRTAPQICKALSTRKTGRI